MVKYQQYQQYQHYYIKHQPTNQPTTQPNPTQPNA